MPSIKSISNPLMSYKKTATQGTRQEATNKKRQAEICRKIRRVGVVILKLSSVELTPFLASKPAGIISPVSLGSRYRKKKAPEEIKEEATVSLTRTILGLRRGEVDDTYTQPPDLYLLCYISPNMDTPTP